MSIKILALSSSRSGNSGYLETALPLIREFLGPSIRQIAFIPFASVDDYHVYHARVKDALKNLPHNIHLVLPENARSLISACDCIMIGGGNTFKLLHDIYNNDLAGLIRQKISAGAHYIGWSAGSNILGISINTTNDMPIMYPPSFEAIGAFPFLINSHYLNEVKEGFNGETRDMRLEEFLKLNPGVTVCALPEGTALVLQNDNLSFSGHKPGYLLQHREGDMKKTTILPENNLNHLLK